MRIAFASLALLAAATLTACDSGDDAAAPAPSQETVTVTPEPTTEPDPEPTVEPEPTEEANTETEDLRAGLSQDQIDQAFVEVLQQQEDGEFDGVPDETLIEAANLVCDLFDSGQTFFDVSGSLMDADFSAGASGYFVGAAVVGYCPEYEDQVNGA